MHRPTRTRNVLLLLVFSFLLTSQGIAADKPDEVAVHQVLKTGETHQDARLKKPRSTRDKFHPWAPVTTKEGWAKQREEIRKQILVSNGLWPMPPKLPLKPTVHSKIFRGEYTIEKVFFESHPGHYVCGNLYRPTKVIENQPGILSPYGHYANGRFYEANIKRAKGHVAGGGEKHFSGAMYPVQARLAQLARMGCTVFQYDMVGYADSKKLGHADWFANTESGLRLQNGMGLQTFNSIRALDFLMSLPEVDQNRIGVTGSSGGGTQTFMLCALDPRPHVAFPAVMVSTGMQGGCFCENASYLRYGINNVAIASLFAPKPMSMTGANDWTIDIETKGLPELKTVYSHYGKADLVHAKCYPQYEHNYNNVARNMMYNFMIKHLDIEVPTPFEEEDFWPVPPQQLSVFDEEHPLPANAKSGEELRAYMTEYSNSQLKKLMNPTTGELTEYRNTIGGALDVMLGKPLSQIGKLSQTTEESHLNDSELGTIGLYKGLLSQSESGASIPYLFLATEDFTGDVILWLDDAGKKHLFTEQGDLKDNIRRTLKNGYAVTSIDLFLTGESLQDRSFEEAWQVDENFHGYTFCLNKPLPAHRVGDILAAVKSLQNNERIQTIHITGQGTAAICALLASGRMDDRSKLGDLRLDLNQFGFENVTQTTDPMFLPGALKYGGLYPLGFYHAPFRTVSLSGVSAKGLEFEKFEQKQSAFLKDKFQRTEKINLSQPSKDLSSSVWDMVQ